MNVKIEIINNKTEKVSPYAFGTLFTNINECTIDETPMQTFANIGVHIGDTIQDVTGTYYKIADICGNELSYVVKLKTLNLYD